MSDVQGWWLQAEGRVFGPYSAQQLAGFLQQGRLAAASRMARSPQGPFASASVWPELAPLFQPTQPTVAPTPGPAEARPLIVLAALRETTAEVLEAALLTFGSAVRIRGTFWASRARLPAAGLRNALSRKLQPGEFLFVAEVEAGDAAWFNLDADVDRAVRRLWAKGG